MLLTEFSNSLMYCFGSYHGPIQIVELSDIFGVVDAGAAGIHYDTNMSCLTITRQHMTANPKLSSFILFPIILEVN